MSSIFEGSNSVWTGRMLSVLRIVAGLLFLEHGTQKLFGIPASPTMHMTFPISSLLGFAGTLETIGGVVLILGFLTRPVAFIMAGEMAVAYFKSHHPRSMFPVNNMGDTPILFCFIFLYLIFAGAGSWSLDAKIAGRSSTTSVK